jgi:hypothetical protein
MKLFRNKINTADRFAPADVVVSAGNKTCGLRARIFSKLASVCTVVEKIIHFKKKDS